MKNTARHLEFHVHSEAEGRTLFRAPTHLEAQVVGPLGLHRGEVRHAIGALDAGGLQEGRDLQLKACRSAPGPTSSYISRQSSKSQQQKEE